MRISAVKGRIRRWSSQYKKLYARLPWPLRIVMVMLSAVLGVFAAIVIYELALIALGILIVFGGMWLFAGSGRRNGSFRSNDDEYMQAGFDAEQRQHEDEGRV